jgi:hypothetical protein
VLEKSGPLIKMGNSFIGQFKFTGETENASYDTLPAGDITNPINQESEDNSLYNNGNTVQADPNTPNCGLYNGERICVSELPSGGCNVTPKGSYICSVGTTPPSTTAGTTPQEVGQLIPQDETGTSADNTAATVYQFSGGQAAQSQQTLESIKGSLDAIKSGQCGGTGQPACKTDEEGDTYIPGTGEFDTSGLGGETSQAWANFKTELSNIREEAQTLLVLNAGGIGELPCDDINIMGQIIPMCIADYSDQLAILAYAIIFVSLALSAFIILR